MISTGIDAQVLVRNWWAVVLRGVLGILFGVCTLLAPGISLAALVLVFGAYALADGILAIISAARRRAGEPRWIIFFEGLVGLAAGIAALLWPGLTALALVYLIASWALVTGAFEIAAAMRLRKSISGDWWLALIGVVSIVLGVLLVVFPGPGALALVLWVGSYALVSGAFLVALGLRLRSWGRSHGAGDPIGAHAPV